MMEYPVGTPYPWHRVPGREGQSSSTVWTPGVVLPAVPFPAWPSSNLTAFVSSLITLHPTPFLINLARVVFCGLQSKEAD